MQGRRMEGMGARTPSEAVAEMMRLRTEGKSITEIAELIGYPRSTVYDIVKKVSKGRSPYFKKCPLCRREFMTFTRQQKYCSKTHLRSAWNYRHKGWDYSTYPRVKHVENTGRPLDEVKVQWIRNLRASGKGVPEIALITRSGQATIYRYTRDMQLEKRCLECHEIFQTRNASTVRCERHRTGRSDHASPAPVLPP